MILGKLACLCPVDDDGSRRDGDKEESGRGCTEG